MIQNQGKCRIKIQCPSCGINLILDENYLFYCNNCKRLISEKEIRENCGL